MQAKNILYAAVGAPVVAARKVGEQMTAFKGKVSTETTGYAETAEKAIDSWAVEGQKVVNKISEGKVVEEISAKVDLDQAKEQVGKLRDQLEDMLATWRSSFRPEKAADESGASAAPTTEVDETAEKAPAKPKTTKTPASKSDDAKETKASAAKTTQSSSATKKSSAKTSAAKAEAS